MRYRCKTFLALTMIFLTCLLSTAVSAQAVDTGVYSGSYNDFRLFCDSGTFYGICFDSKNAVGLECSSTLSDVYASDFVSGDSSIVTCFYLNAEFYAVCIGRSYDVPGQRDVMVYKGDSPENAYLCYAQRFPFSAKDAVSDLSLNVYSADNTHPWRICSVSAYTGMINTYELDSDISCIAANDALSSIAAACSNNVYIKNLGSSEFTLVASLPENITKMYYLSDSHILCNGRYIIDKYGNYYGHVQDCTYDSRGCCLDGYFYLTGGGNVYKYDSSLALIHKYKISGTVYDCAAYGTTLAVLADCGGKLCIISPEKDNDNSSNTVSSKSSSDSTDKIKTDNNSNITDDSKTDTQQKKQKVGEDAYCTIIYVSQGTTVSNLLKSSELREKNAVCTSYSGKVVTSGKIGTGAHVTVKTTGDKYDIVLTGDVTGEGNINSKDIDTMCNALVGNISFNSIQSFAADVNKDGTVDLLDLLCDEELTKGKYTPEY